MGNGHFGDNRPQRPDIEGLKPFINPYIAWLIQILKENGTYTEVRLGRGTFQLLKFLKDSHYSATLRGPNHAFL